MLKDKTLSLIAVQRDLTAISLPTKLPLQKTLYRLEGLIYNAIRSGDTSRIESVCQSSLLSMLNATTELAVVKGGRRSQLSSEKVINEPRGEYAPIRFSLQDEGDVVANGVANYLKKVSGIDPTKTNNKFRQQNAGLINGLSKEVCDTIQKTIKTLVEKNIHVRGGANEVAKILLKAGLDPQAVPRLAETIFRTQSAAAYNAGRWNIVNDSDTAPYIWGFEYVTVGDNRVRPEHRLLEGVRLPKDDPFWQKYMPPNGWNCRCTILEIWNDEEIAKKDYGVTGVDPHKRTEEELNLLPAFKGNVGMLAGKPKPEQKKATVKPELKVEKEPTVYEIESAKEKIKAAILNAKQSKTKTKVIVNIEESKSKSLSIDPSRVLNITSGGKQIGTVTVDAGGVYTCDLYDKKEPYKNADKVVKFIQKLVSDKLNIKPATSIKVVWGRREYDLPNDLSDITVGASPGGSTGAKLATDAQGNKFIYKTGGGATPSEHVENEAATDIFYRDMGIKCPECRIYKENGKTVKLSKFVENGTLLGDWLGKATKTQRDDMKKKLLKGFATDVLLGNWDVIGMGADNIIIDELGEPWRIDNGGAMGFRAQGTPKKQEEWKSGFPDDIFTMTSGNKGDYFGKQSAMEILELIDSTDFSKAVQKLPKEDKAIVEKRIEECHQLAVRGRSYKVDYKEDFVETIIKQSFELSKEGFREAVPDPDLKKGKYGYFRTPGRNSIAAQSKLKIEVEDTYPDEWQEMLDAIKSINFHNGANGDKKPNDATVNKALAEYNYMQYNAKNGTDSGKKLAKWCLDVLDKIKDAYQNGTTIGYIDPASSNVSPYYLNQAPVTPATVTTNSKYSSLTDWIHERIRDNGGDVNFITRWQASQSGNSYSEGACKFKLIKLQSMGVIDLKTQDKDEIINKAEKAGYYMGQGKQQQKYEMDTAINKLKKLSGDEIDMLVKTLGIYQSAIQLILENSTFEGNGAEEHKTQSIVLARTESPNVIDSNAKNWKRGKPNPEPFVCIHNVGVNESHAIINAVVVKGSYLTTVRVPYSRITGCYMLERYKNQKDCCFLGDSENEFDADTHGLTKLCWGNVDHLDPLYGENTPPIKPNYIKKHIDWEKSHNLIK